MSVFNLPDLGEGLQEAEIVNWHVSVGDHVITDQPLVSVETDKAVVEIPAPFSGTIETILANAGDIIATDAPLVDIQTGKAEDAGAIVGDLQREEVEPKPVARPPSIEVPSASKNILATPAVRKLAREKGINLDDLQGSGPEGTIRSADVIAATTGLYEGEELRGVRRAMAKAMTHSHATVVPATLTDSADIHGWPPSENPTLRLIHAIATACEKESALNAWFDGRKRQLHDHVDLAIAVDTPDGLFAPVLRSVEGTDDILEQLAALRKAVENRSISPESLKGGTFTLSNFGMIGGEHAVLVITPPQVAILGAGRIAEVYTVAGGAPAIRRMLPLSLTFDHRAVTGGEAARFMAAVKNDLERDSTIE